MGIDDDRDGSALRRTRSDHFSDRLQNESIAGHWQGAKLLRENCQRHVGGEVAGLADILYTVSFLLAFDVLKPAVVKAGRLGYSPFADYVRVKKRRYAVARHGAIYTANECLADISAIENQLRAWNFIP